MTGAGASKFLFSRPDSYAGASRLANEVIALGALASRLALEPRTRTNHMDGRPESVAEHAHMLSRVALHVANQLYPSLDIAKVLAYATVHDDLEAYVGDTPTDRITPADVTAKAVREAAALKQLKKDYATIPEYVEWVSDYEEQEVAEARLVRVLDKCMPILQSFANKGTILQAHWTPETMLENARQKAIELHEDYPDFNDLIDLRMELTKLAAAHLFRQS